MERRKTRRYDIDLFVNVELEKTNSNCPRFASRTRNISSDGAYLMTEAPLKEGTPVKLELFLAVDRLLSLIGEKQKVKVRLKGQVVRTGDAGIAIHFNKGYQFTTLNMK